MTDQTIIMTLLLNLPSIACVGFGGFLCYKEKDGWGWFLFAALMLARLPDGVRVFR